MNNVTFARDGGTLIVSLSDRIDSLNAPELERLIDAECAKQEPERIVMDCARLAYMSSAGLRVVLRLRKRYPDVSAENVSSEMYDIFEVTGFTEIIEVKKAYRTISVEGCEVIGEGANGRVYRIDRDTIVKVYLKPDALPDIHRERELARTAFVLGIPTAIPYDVVRVEGGGYGSVFELLNAKSFAQCLISGEKSVDEIVAMSVDLLRIIHGTEVKADTLPDIRKIAVGWADDLAGRLPAELTDKMRALFAAVPADRHILHGDYQIKNVMLQDGESLLIDMDTLCCGHPIFELGCMYNTYCASGEMNHEDAKEFLGISYETALEIWDKILRLYLDGADEEKIRSVEEKAAVIGYARVMRRRINAKKDDTEEGRAEIANCVRRLSELLPKIDTMLF